jgi:hypothetical protein
MLRLHTPLASGPFHKAVPVGGDTVCGYHLPYGARVSTNGAVYAMGRDKAFWGPDTDMFRPERWTEADPVKRQRMIDMTDLAWSHGAFACPGKAIGLMQAGKAISEVCLFSPVSLDGLGGWEKPTLAVGCPPLRHHLRQPQQARPFPIRHRLDDPRLLGQNREARDSERACFGED